MAAQSVRASMTAAVCEAAAWELVLCDSESEAFEIFDFAIEDVIILQTQRCVIPRQPIPKSDKWFIEILPELDENRFRHFMRVTRKDFALIMQQIQDHEVFTGVNSVLQLPLSKQLAITLYKLGFDGAGSSVCNVAALFGIGDGGTVMKVMRRVLKAILAKEVHWISWPDTNERLRIKYLMADKLPGCMGYIDGTHIIVDEAPIDDPESYYTRKQRYAVQLQAICDNDKRIRNIFVGFPGSVHDARVFANSEVGNRIQGFLSENEWIAGDSAYGNTRYIVTPFKSNSSVGTDRQRKQFNRYFSGFRVNVECCFGKLKEIFQSLKGIRIRIDRENGHELACDWIRACCVIYNMILPSLEMNMSEYELIDDEYEVLDNEPQFNEQRNSVFTFVINKLGL